MLKKAWSISELEKLAEERSEAKRLNHKYYYRRKKCSKGHLAPYFVSTGQCVECGRERARERYRDDPKRMQAYNRAMYEKHREKRLVFFRRYKIQNPEIIKRANDKRDKKELREASRQYRADNPEKVLLSNARSRKKHQEKRNELSRRWREANYEKISEYNKAYRKQNKTALRLYDSAHYSKVRRQMPAWANRNKIMEIYHLRMFGK